MAGLRFERVVETFAGICADDTIEPQTMDLILAFVALLLIGYGVYCALTAWENRLREGPYPTLFDPTRFNPRGRRYLVRFWLMLIASVIVLWIDWQIT
jgi:hypothetical protein